MASSRAGPCLAGGVSPADIIPLAEEASLINALGEWVLRTACTEAVTWPAHLKVAVNFSPVQFRDGRRASMVRNILHETDFPGSRLEVEITEGVLLQDEYRTLAILRELRGMDIRISMDDFGTGSLSLSYLRRFPFDKIKIDQSFIRQTSHDKDSAATMPAIPVLAIGQITHGLTFALLHLANMRLMAEIVPARLAATTQTPTAPSTSPPPYRPGRRASCMLGSAQTLLGHGGP